MKAMFKSLFNVFSRKQESRVFFESCERSVSEKVRVRDWSVIQVMTSIVS